MFFILSVTNGYFILCLTISLWKIFEFILISSIKLCLLFCPSPPSLLALISQFCPYLFTSATNSCVWCVSLFGWPNFSKSRRTTQYFKHQNSLRTHSLGFSTVSLLCNEMLSWTSSCSVTLLFCIEFTMLAHAANRTHSFKICLTRVSTVFKGWTMQLGGVLSLYAS